MKIFASECLALIEALDAFDEAALRPKGQLLEEVNCFALLADICNRLR